MTLARWRILINVPFLVEVVPCELCGTEVARTRKTLVDKTVLQVCPSCERFGTVLEGPAAKRAPAVSGNVPLALERRRRQQAPKDVFQSESMNLELVADFATRIKTAREKKGWTRQDLGSRVGEREVVIARIENGALHPPDDVAHKMERELGIKLFEPVQAGTMVPPPRRALTLGDMLKDARKKQEP